MINIFQMCMVQTFIKLLWWRFLFSRLERLLINSETLSCKTRNISTFSMLLYYNTNNGFFWDVSMHWSVQFILINVLGVFEHKFFILKFHWFKFLFYFIISKYSFFSRIIWVLYQFFQICLVFGQFPCKYLLYSSLLWLYLELWLIYTSSFWKSFSFFTFLFLNFQQ